PDSVAAAEHILTRRLPRQPGALGRNQIPHLGFTNARGGRKWQIGLYNSDTGEMINPQVIWTLPDGTVRWLSAERAARTNGVWTFYNLREYKEAPKVNSLPVPTLQTNILAFPQFSETPDQIKSEIRLANSIALPGAKKA